MPKADADDRPAERSGAWQRGFSLEIERAHAAGKRWFAVRRFSPALAANSEGRSGEINVAFALPEAATPALRQDSAAPLVIFLPGFGSAPHAYGPESNPVMRAVDEATRRGELPAMLVAVVDGRTRFGGGCYVDSPVTGSWTTFLIRELLPQLLATLGPRRVVVAGHSMGGFGALHVGLEARGAISGVVAISPILRSSVLTDRLLPVVHKLAAKNGRTSVAKALTAWSSLAFSEKLFWALLAAWAGDVSGHAGVPAPFASESPDSPLNERVLAAAERFDIPNRVAHLTSAGLAKVGRVYVGLGSRDGLTPAADATALQTAWRSAAGVRPSLVANLELRLHGGDHASEAAADLVRGLRFVLAANAPGKRARR